LEQNCCNDPVSESSRLSVFAGKKMDFEKVPMKDSPADERTDSH
jgi:hypothetical protein